MKTTQTIFSCSKCDAQFTKWTGRCLSCGGWGTLSESKVQSGKLKDDDTASYPETKTSALKNLALANTPRLTTKNSELDRVLGGGLVPGSLILLGGEPGIGKSTLSLQLATSIPSALYLSAEESLEQIKLRADRLGFKENNLELGNVAVVESICATIKSKKPKVVIVDSIQTIYSPEATGEPGNVTQIRASTVKLLECAKVTNTTIILVSHVTKDGTVSGPKTLEHLVDVVLYLEGDRHHSYRILRGVKNRFGATDEIGIFEMKESGLVMVENPSAALLSERDDSVAGSVVTCLIEGTRPLLVEIQALVTKTVFGYPVRKSNGFDLNRLHVIVAVLEKRAGLTLGAYDIHVNVVGGLSADEPAADLAVALAIASAYRDKPLGKNFAVFGELGLGGEIRSVSRLDNRLKECKQMGIATVITNPGRGKFTPTPKIMAVKKIFDVIKQQ